MKIEFLVQGSEPNPYRVEFSREGDNFTATCTCRAGQLKQICKHRLNLLKGETEGITQGDPSNLLLLPKLFDGTDVEAAFEKVVAAEEAVEQAKLELERRKKALARAFHD